jgi:hypothetical protein
MAKRGSANRPTSEIARLAAAQADDFDPSDVDLSEIAASLSETDEESLALGGEPAAAAAGEFADLVSARNELIERLGGSLMAAHAAAGALSLAAGGTDPLSALNIQAIGAGLRQTSGVYTGEMAVKVYVLRKARESSLSPDMRIPAEIGGIPTDVHEVTPFLAQAGFQGRFPRPVPCGCQFGSTRKFNGLFMSGTIGFMVLTTDNKRCLLTNNHVAALENKGVVGDHIVQPAAGNTPADFVGKLHSFKPLVFNGNNEVDAALVHTSKEVAKASHVKFTVNPAVVAPTAGKSVAKNGATTGATMGTIVDAFVESVSMGYKSGTAFLRNQMFIQGVGGKFSDSGDSGAGIVDAVTKQPIGLLVGGEGNLTTATPIKAVMQALKIQSILAS